MLKKISLLGIMSICLANQVYADFPEMMKIYKNPSSAPKAQGCRGDIYCNAFIALSKQWKSIPDTYRYHGFDIKADAKKGVTYDDQGRNIGLQNGFYFQTDISNKMIDSVMDNYVETKKSVPYDFEGGLAVLLYIEDKNGWAKD